MKKLLAILVAMLVLPFAFAAGVSTGITPNIETEDFAPLVWMCGDRVVYDDPWQTGTTSNSVLVERQQNYAFEGESIQWNVLVMDKNGINKVEDVFATIGSSQGAGNDIEVNCVENLGFSSVIEPSCNARILEEDLTNETLDVAVQRYYTCELTIEPMESMYGEYFITVEAVDLDGLSGTMAENEYWFLNPVIALSIDGDLTFENVRPGTAAYSSTLLVGNDADAGSGVRLQMFISGTNFYDTSSSGAMCPTSNELDLNRFSYFASNGAYTTAAYGPSCSGPAPCADAEGYMGIPYGDELRESKEIMGTEEFDDDGADLVYGDMANVLTPGSEMAITFRLMLPEPCNGDFDSGAIYFWGEAI
jgi:hypothetical protein